MGKLNAGRKLLRFATLMLKGLRSFVKLGSMIGREAGCAIRAVLRGDCQTASAHVRALGNFLHDELLTVLVAAQKHLRLWPAPGRDIDRILVIKLDRIGDMVLTTPVFDALHAQYPRARLDIVADAAPLVLLDGDRRIAERFAHRTWLYHPSPMKVVDSKAWRLVVQLMRRRYPLVVYLRGSFPFLLLGLVSRLAAAKFVKDEPTIERYMKPLETLAGPMPRPRPRLQVDPEASRLIHDLFHRNNGRGPHIAIHATASGPTKIWPTERFAALADELHRLYRAHVHFLGAAADKPLLDSIAELAAYPHSYHCSFRLPQVVAAIAACNLFIGNDSGLAHIGAAVGTPLVVLWGSANLRMARPCADADKMVVLYHDVPCRDTCLEFKCTNPIQLDCMKRIQIDDVVYAAGSLLTAGFSLRACPLHEALSRAFATPSGVIG
jgi:ADP-heptose:LPS heptosyltransferase